MTVYPDLLFLVGTVIHAAAFDLALRLNGLKRTKKCLLGAVGGGIVCVLDIVPFRTEILSVPIAIGLSVLIFRGKTVRGTLKNLAGYGAVLIGYVGLFIVALAANRRIELVRIGEEMYLSSPFFSTLFAASIGYAVGRIVLHAKRKALPSRSVLPCTVENDLLRITANCYCDTGNFLTDPTDGLPVAIFELAVLHRALHDKPDPISARFARLCGTKYRIVPYRGIGGEATFLAGFSCEIRIGNRTKKAVAVFTPDRLEARGRFDGIVGPELWEERV